MVLETLSPAIRDALAPYTGNNAVNDALFLVGATVAASAALSVVRNVGKWIYSSFIRRPINVAKLGKWAVITGATDGIGRAYAKALAKRGMSICLISRTQERLDEAAKEIQEKYKVETKTIVVDYSAFDEAKAAEVRNELDQLEVGVLVNNVGVSYEHPEYFENLTEKDIRNIIRMNNDSVVVMSHIVISQMVKRKKGAIINISSGSGLVPMGLLTVYSASKAFVDFFSRSLLQEYPYLYIQSVLPFMVVSKLSGLRKAVWNAPTADEYVRVTLTTLGYESRTTGYWAHRLQEVFFDNVPYFPLKYTLDMHKSIRTRALKKKARIAAEGKKE